MGQLIFIIDTLFQAYILVIFLRAVLPWVPHNRYHPMFSWIYAVTEPLLLPIREGMPPMKIGIDVSPFVAMLLVWCLWKVIISLTLFLYAKFSGNAPGMYIFMQGLA